MRFRQIIRWVWSRRWRVIFVSLLFIFIGVNLIAYLHARALTHFGSGTVRTASPESLTILQKARILVMGIDNPRPENHATPEKVDLSFTALRIAGENDESLEAWHIPRSGSKALVLMFHGYAACKEQELDEARAFHEFGYAVLIIDFRGSGGSSGNDTTLGIREADDVVRVWEFAQSTWKAERVILYGQSMGSVAILRALATHQDIQPAAVVLECPFDTMRNAVANRFSAMRLPASPGTDLLLFWGSVQIAFNGYRHNPVEYAKEVRCPVLQMHGAKDKRVTEEQAKAIFENFSRTKEIHIFSDAGHESYFAMSPNEWLQTVAAFLNRFL